MRAFSTGRGWRWPRIAFLVLIAAGVLFVSVPSAQVDAHANRIRSSPAPDAELEDSPERVIIWFSEPIEDALSEVRVLDELAQQVDNGDSALSPTEPTALVVTLPPLENGTYTVVWRNLSTVDGHRVVGSFRFAVGEPLSAGTDVPVESQPLIQSAADPWLRWIFFVGALGLAGVLIFDLLVIRPALRRAETTAVADGMPGLLHGRMFMLMLASVGLMTVGLLALLIQQAAITFEVSVFEVFGTPVRSVLDSDWGRLWMWRMLVVVASGVLVVLAMRSVRDSGSGGDEDFETMEGSASDEFDDGEVGADVAVTESIFGALALAVSVVILGLTSLSSHSAAVPVELRTPAIITDFLHLLGASVWIGGLFLVAAVVPLFMRRSDGADDRQTTLLPLLRRFSPLAFASAGVLVVTGIVSGYMQVTIPAATNTPYGWTLVTKVALIIPLFIFAAINSYLVGRWLLRTGRLSFRKLVRVEVLVALLVLASVGWLAGLEPARQFAARNGIGVAEQVTFSDFAEGANIDAEITPGDVGENTVTVTLTDRGGEPITNAIDVRMRLKFLEEDLGEPLISLTDAGEGTWTGEDFNITIGGIYQAEVRVIRPDAFDAFTSFRFDAAPVGGATDAISPDRTVAWTLFAIEILAIGLILVFVGTPAMKRLVPSMRPLLLPGAAFSVMGVALLLNAQVFRAGFPEEQFNPFPVNAESIETGRMAYEATCATCHGVEGHGHGPMADELSSPPADLSVHVPLHSDSELFRFIRDGVPGTEMPAMEGVLTEDEMWHIVNYLRTFGD